MKNLFRAALAALFSLLLGQKAFSQDLSGIINSYAKVTAIDTCTGQLTVSTTAGFQVGGAVLLWQTQDGTLNSGNNSSFGSFATFGFIGACDENEVAAITPPSSIFLKNNLVNKFNLAGGSVQLVSYPKFDSATVVDTLFAQKWDGQTGGMLAISAKKIVLKAPLMASGCGFRGGAATSPGGNNCNWAIPQSDYFYDMNNWRGAMKGEGIAQTLPGKEAGKGAMSTGGGGGNDHNSGGGGGGNYAGGGNGGRNDEPSAFGCKGNHPGKGGYSLGLKWKHFWMGGGGGAGHGNNSSNGAGGAGGGIIILVADTISGVTGQQAWLVANGDDGGKGTGDGAGGGGAGGYIFLQYADMLTPPGLSLRAAGGKGGDEDEQQQDRCMGPGGGGSGGFIFCNHALGVLPSNINSYAIDGGQPGIVTNSIAACNGSSNGAMAGSDGVFSFSSVEIFAGQVAFGAPAFTLQPTDQIACTGTQISFSTTASGGTFTYQWQVNTGSGWADIPVGSPDFSGMNSPVLTVLSAKTSQNGWKFRLKLHSTGGCATADVLSNEAKLTVKNKPTVAFVSSVAANLATTFTNLSLNCTNYLWDFGDGQTSTAANPAHQYAMQGSYTVVLTGWNLCDTILFTQTVVVEAPPEAAFFVENPILGCGNNVSVKFQNLSAGTITNYAWAFPTGSPSLSTQPSPTVKFFTSGSHTATLTVTGATGATSTTSQTIDVQLFKSPVAGFTFTVNGPTVTFTNTSTNGLTYFWDFGDGATASTFDAAHTFSTGGEHIVTLVVDNPCGASVLQKLVILTWVAAGETAPPTAVRVFPNPTDGPLSVETELPDFRLQLIDLQGVLVFEKEISGGEAALDLTALAAGTYFLKIAGKGGQVVRRLVKI